MYIFDIEHMEGTCGIFHFLGKKIEIDIVYIRYYVHNNKIWFRLPMCQGYINFSIVTDIAT